MLKRCRWILILGINILLYINAGMRGLWTMLASVLLAYIAGTTVEKITKYRKLLMSVYILTVVGMMFFCKLSPGISYYSLACMGYVIDVYRGKYGAEKNPFLLGAFVSFFPVMVQGPICRYDELKEDLFDGKIQYETFTYGLTRIVFGGLKKLVVADRLAIVFDALCNVSGNGTAIVVNMLVYAFYLYADFSGGIDIAIGLGYIMGIKLPENFKSPFFAVSISDYWRKWHITLGGWLRDYVFYPISLAKPVTKFGKNCRKVLGNRIGKKIPIYISTIIVWFVTGLWHGTKANFIVWGLLNGIIILVSLELEPLYNKFNKRFEFTKGRIYSAFRMVRTFCLMAILRMLDYNTVKGYIESILLVITDFSIERLVGMEFTQLGLDKANWLVVLLGVILILVVDFIGRKRSYDEIVLKKGIVVSYSLIAIMIVIIVIFGMYGIGYEGKAFIYSRY